MWPFRRKKKLIHLTKSLEELFPDLSKLGENCPHEKCICRTCPRKGKCATENEVREKGCMISVREMVFPVMVTSCSYKASADSKGERLSGYEEVILDTLFGGVVERAQEEQRREEEKKRTLKEMKRGIQ